MAVALFLAVHGSVTAAVTHVFFGIVTKLTPNEMTVRDPRTGQTKSFRLFAYNSQREFTQTHSGKLFVQKGEAVKVLYEQKGTGLPQADVINAMDRMPPNVR